MRPDEEARLAAALRENLRRRKARSRALAVGSAAPAPEAGEVTATEPMATEPTGGGQKSRADQASDP
jgi:hypothetical protein